MSSDIGELPEVETYNRWLDYNDPDGIAVHATAAEIEVHYRRLPYIQAVRSPPRSRPLQGPLAPIFPSSPIDPAEHGPRLAGILDADGNPPSELEPPSRQNLVANWKGRRILGEGHNGIVALFEYDPAAPDQPTAKKVVVKQCPANATLDLEIEAIYLASCRDHSFSTHILRLITTNDAITSGIRRIVLEYCPQGSLQDLLDRRISRRLPFKEITLWRVFECLVDACSVLEYGRELTLSHDPKDVKAIAHEVPDWPVIIHSDIKPDNIVMANQNRTHTQTPICKLADFGAASALPDDPDVQKLDRKHMKMREFGTPGYYTPEQFTPRWNYQDWTQSGVAGAYCSATNIWGIGAVMYQLTCLDELPPNHIYPFTPNYQINGAPAKGDTYGFDIGEQDYSDTLKHMILECLYEKPAHRCNLRDMKYIITKAIDDIIEKDGVEGDNWIDLEIPQPGAPVIYPSDPPVVPVAVPANVALGPPPLPAAGVPPPPPPIPAGAGRTFAFICQHIYPAGHPKAGMQCGNKRRQVAGPRIRCQRHVNL